MPSKETVQRISRLTPADLADDVVAATRALGGEAQRAEIIDRALDLGGWSDEERAVVSWYTGAARKYHLRTLADYAVTVCKDRGTLQPGSTRGRWRLPDAATIVPHRFGRVFTASVGLGDEPVDDDWAADAYDHVWFATRSLQLSRGDHLFVLGAGRHSAVLGLYEVTSAGTSTTPRNPWNPRRWKYAIGVRALAAVPPAEAVDVPGVTAPRGAAHHIRDVERQAALYEAVAGHELGATTTTFDELDGDVRAAADARRPRPFDPTRSPSPPISPGAAMDPDETLALQEKARDGHQALLARLAVQLARRGWQQLEEIPAAIDLRGCRPDGQRVIFEAKTLSGDNELTQTRSALAQLLEYRLDYGRPEDLICLAVDGPLSPRRAEVLQRLGVGAVVVTVDAVAAVNEAGDEAIADLSAAHP